MKIYTHKPDSASPRPPRAPRIIATHWLRPPRANDRPHDFAGKVAAHAFGRAWATPSARDFTDRPPPGAAGAQQPAPATSTTARGRLVRRQDDAEGGMTVAAELAELTSCLPHDELAALERAGLGFEAIWSEPCGPVTAGAIRTDGPDFEFAEDGRRALVMPVRCELDVEVVDALAWHPGNPSRWWQRTGSAYWLGASCVRMSWILEVPLPIRRTPIDWLAHRGHGVVMLDPRMCRLDLQDVEIVAEDVRHARELERLLWPPRLPRPRILLEAA